MTLLKPSFKHSIYLISHDINILKQGLEWGVSIIQLRNSASEILNDALSLPRLLKGWYLHCRLPRYRGCR